MDFYSPANYIIPTQIKLGVPLRYYGRLASKSGLAILHQLHVGVGVIEPDYTGEIMDLLINTASHVHHIIRGDPIAQLIFHLLLGELMTVAFETSIYIYTLIHIVIYS